MDVQTGYVADVKVLDDVLRYACVAVFSSDRNSGDSQTQLPRRLLEECEDRIPAGLEAVSVTVGMSPYTRLEVQASEPTMTSLTHQFEFSAAHRLHCPELSDEENRHRFGKCNNPNGHGHNYVLDVTVRRSGSDVPSLSAIEDCVRERVLEYLDHRNLNLDCPEFQSTNPTVENIARLVWRRLSDALPHLDAVRVYETPKTWAEVCANRPAAD